MIQNAFIRIVNPTNQQELIRYNLTDDYSGKTSLIVGEIYRNGTEWKFAAVGNGTTAPSLSELGSILIRNRLLNRKGIWD